MKRQVVRPALVLTGAITNIMSACITRLLVIVLVVTLCPSPVFAEDSLKVHLAVTAFMAAHGADLYTTGYCIGARTCREVNPVFVPLADRPVVFGALKMGTAALTSWVLLRSHKQHPRLVFWLATVGAAGVSAAAVHNARIGRSR